MPRGRHPKKQIEAVLKVAEAAGWTVTPKAAGHAWGFMRCGDGCVESIWSTPKNADNHAKRLRRAIAKCPH